MKKILMISTAPIESRESASLRKISNIKTLIKIGHEVTIVSVSPIKKSNNYSNVTIKGLQKIYMEPRGIHSIAVTKKKSILKKFAREIYYKCRIYDPMKSYASKSTEIIGELEKKYDYIISISDPKSSHLMAINLIETNCIEYKKYIQIWGDPMSLDVTKNTVVPNWLIQREEEKLLTRADKIYYVSPLTLIKQKEIFGNLQKKMDVIYPGYIEKSFYTLKEKIINIGYFGDYNSKIRNIEPLYKSVNDTEFNLCIWGNSDLKLSETKNIKICTRKPFNEVKNKEEEIDLLVCLANKGGHQIPGKIYQYLGTNKPILFILDGEDKEEYIKIFGEYKNINFCDNIAESIIGKIRTIDLKEKLEPIEKFYDTNAIENLLKYLECE